MTELGKKGASSEQIGSLLVEELVPALENTHRRIRDHRATVAPDQQRQADVALEYLGKQLLAARKMAYGLRSNDRAAIEEGSRLFEEAFGLLEEALKDPPEDHP